MAVDIQQPLKALEHPLQDSIRELRQGYQSLAECLEQTIAESDLRGSELADCRRQLSEVNRRLHDREKQLTAKTQGEAAATGRCSALEKELESHRTDLSQTNADLLRAQAEAMQSKDRLELQIEKNKELLEQLNHCDTDRGASHNELAQLRAQFASMAQSAAEAAALRGELTAAQAELERLREQLAAGPVESRQLQAGLSAAQSELASTKAALAQAQAEAAKSDDRLQLQTERNQELRDQIERLETDREARQTEVAQLRAEVASAQAEAARASEQLVARPDDSGAREQLTAANAEREQLENELEMLRSRGAELAELVEQQKKQLSQEREVWTDEMRQWRRTIDRQTELLAEKSQQAPTAAAAAPAPEQPASRNHNGSQPDSLVVDSVLEQFTMLQKNKVRKLANPAG